MKKDPKQQTSCAFDKVLSNLKKLNGTKIASYLLGYIDGAFLIRDDRSRAKTQFYFPEDASVRGRRK